MVYATIFESNVGRKPEAKAQVVHNILDSVVFQALAILSFATTQAVKHIQEVTFSLHGNFASNNT